MKNRINSILALGAFLTLLPLGLPQAYGFTHPGAPLTSDDLSSIKAKVDQGIEPWKSGYAALVADGRSQLNYTMHGPFATVSRAPNVNLSQWDSDMIAIWNLSLMWNFTGNTAYAQKAHDILLAWANTQTSFTGGECMLELGDYAFMFVGGADILRGTWPGWTDADTTTVKAYFGNVLLPATNPYGESQYGAANKGALALVAGGLLAIFDDDSAKVDDIVYKVRTLAHIGLRSSNEIGMVGDSLRDQGHAHGQLLSLAMLAEALWKQGIDIYSDYNNRLLTDGEYFARVNKLVPTPFLPFGTTDAYYTADNTHRGWGGGNRAMSVLHGAYVVRKGLPAPYITQRIREMPVDSTSFMFMKDADSSVATPAVALSIPSTTSITAGFSNVDLGGATPTGSASYSGGIWTVQGAGTEVWASSDSCQFSYVPITGDCAIVAKVESVQNTNLNAKAGVMMRTSLSQGSPRALMWLSNKGNLEQNMPLLKVYGGTYYGNKTLTTALSTYWVKLERIGNIITGYVSPDGTNWAATDLGRIDAPVPDTIYVGLMVCSFANGTLNTSTFSNVQITGGNGGAPVLTPAAPAALLASPGYGFVPLRWQSSFGATSYNVKRSGTSGGPYTTIATVTSPSFTDTAVSNDNPYYYVVTAVNSAGESAYSSEAIVTPRNQYVNIAANNSAGTALASANSSSSSEGAARAFDLNSASKWFNGNTGTTGWIQYDLGPGGGQAVTSYELMGASDVAARDPSAWQLLGSNDGTTWTTLDTQTGQSFNGYLSVPLQYYISNTTPWRYYRMNITANNGDTTGLAVTELALLRPATSVAPPAPPSGLGASSVSLSQIDLSWTAVPGASTYIIKRASTSGGPYTVIASEVIGTTYSDTGLFAGTPYYYVVSALGAGGESANSSEAGATTLSSVTLSFASVAAQDGYVLAASGNSSGGSISSSSSLRTGDNNQNLQYKTVLSFDTSSIPDNAVIVSATLKLRCSGITGTNPFSTLGACNVDIKGGSGFNSNTTLETTDFQAAADAAQVAGLSSVSSVGTWSTGALNAAGLRILNKLGTTQFRVYFSTATNSNNTSDYLSWNAGDDTTAGYRPVLDVVYSIQGPADQPKTWLKFDETTGTNASDSSGNGLAGTLINGATWATGKSNNAVSLSGSSYVTLPPGVVSSTGDFTVSAWVKLNSLSTNSRIFDFGTNTTPGATTGSYMFLTPSNGSGVRFAMTTAGYNNEQALAGSAPLTTGTWTHVAVTLSGSTCKLYVNGAVVGTSNAFNLKPYNLGGTTQNYIGKSQYSADPALNGLVDEFRIYNRALTATEVTALANSPAITSALTAMGRIGTSLGYQITATNTPSSYSATGLPAGLNLASSSGWITGTPTVTGTFHVALGATNPAGTGSANLVLSVLPQLPVITSNDSITGFSNTALSYQIVATNTPSSYAASGLPGGLGINTGTGLISGTPTVTGTFNATLSAINAGGTGSGNLSIVLGIPMLAPTGLTATGGDGAVALAWNAVSGAATYNVKRSITSGSGYTTVGSEVTSPSFTDSDVTNSTTYYYVLTPVNDYGEGPASAEASATPLSPYTWTGGGADANWQTAANWSALPVAGVTPCFAGSTQLSNANNFAANTQFDGIVFNSGAGAFTLGGNAITLTGDIINNSTSTQTLSVPIAFSGASRAIVTASGGVTISGTVSGGSALVKSGTGTLVLSGANLYGGGTTLNAGTLLVQGNSTPTTGTVTSGPLGIGTLTLNGGTFGFTSGGYTIANNVGVQGATNIEVASGATEVLNSNWSGGGNLTLVANGTTGQWQFGGDNSGYTGTLTQNSGNTSLAFNSSSAGSANAAWVFNNPTNQRTRLNFGAGTISFGALSGNGSIANVAVSGSATVSVGALSSSTTFTGILGGSSSGQGQNISLVKVGTGMLTLTGANTYTGTTSVTSGTLALSGAGTLGATTGSLAVSGGTLDLGTTSRTKGAVSISSGSIISGTLTGTSFASTNGGVISAVLSGSAAGLTKSGSGTLTLTGLNTYAGATAITGGTLKLTGSLSSAVTINNGGTLAGTGTCGAAVTVGNGGTIAPGDSSPGSLTIGGLLTLSDGAILTMELGTPSASDAIQLGGSIAASGTTTMNLSAISGFGEGTYPLISGAAAISASNFVVGTVPAGYGGTLNASAGVLSVTLVRIPDSPTNLFATAANSSATLTWTAPIGASSYNVKRSLTSGSGHVTIATVGTASYNDTGLTNGTTYYYVVSAVNSGGESANSTEASALPLSGVQSWRLDNFSTIENTGIAADNADPDGDGWSNWQELAAGTDPNDRASCLKIQQIQTSGSNVVISFPTSIGKTYRLESSNSMQSGSWATVQGPTPGTGGVIQVTDSNGPGQSKCFYRVVVY